MKTKFKSIVIISVLLFILFNILSNSKETIDTVLFGINIWMYNVFPSLFPFFILSDLLINYGFVEFISEIFKNFMGIFNLSGNTSFALFGSIISGVPSGSKYTKQLLNENLISLDEANHLIMFTHYANPLFILGTIGSILLDNVNYGYIVLISHILGGLCTGYIFKRKNYINKENISIYKAIDLMNKKRINNKDNFITILSNSINNTLHILFLLLGTIIIFLVFSNFLNNLNLNYNFLLFLKGIFEMTQGVKYVSMFNYSIIIKLIFITIFISFGGLSVHLQVSSIINDTKIKYKNFLIARVVHSFISIILVYIIYNLFY